MNHSDFHIRVELPGAAGCCWRCGDIQPDHDDDPNRCQGFPLIATEFVFDEHKREQCHLTEEEAIRVVIHEADTSGHPGYPNSDVNHMVRARLEARGSPSPHKGILRFDRRATGRRNLASVPRRQGCSTLILRPCLPLKRTASETPERDSSAFPGAATADVRTRTNRQREARSAITGQRITHHP